MSLNYYRRLFKNLTEEELETFSKEELEELRKSDDTIDNWENEGGPCSI